MPATRFVYEPVPEAQPTSGLLLSKDFGALLLDLLFPPRCAGCDRVDTYWCATCQHAIDQLPFPPVQQFEPDSPLAAVASTGIHKGHLQRAIWALKFTNGRQLTAPLAQRLNRRLAALDWTIDILVPVPLNTQRLQERGYNQSQLLGEYMAFTGNLPLKPQAIQRPVATRSQIGLNPQERQANMVDAFRADPQIVAGQSLLIIDDVFTTGATLSACAQAARDAGAAQVYGLTITQARG